MTMPPRWVTFDCYGTLVDFDLSAATLDLLGRRAARVDLPEFFRVFENIRFHEVLGPYRPYRDVLRHSLERVMRRYGLGYRAADGEALVAAVPRFGPFPDVPPALARLRGHVRLAIVSNTDDDLIAGNLQHIGVPFDRVVTAEQARAYKPSLATFDYLLDQLGCQAGEIVHVAQGFSYDIKPAHALGWQRVWVNRFGQAGDPAYGPYHELPDLTALPVLLGIDAPATV
jgi:2-haloacid dehalogenase